MSIPVMLMSVVVVSMIGPCLVAVGLSQKVHRWPPKASVFNIW